MPETVSPISGCSKAAFSFGLYSNSILRISYSDWPFIRSSIFGHLYSEYTI